MQKTYRQALHDAKEELAYVEKRRENLVKLIDALKVLTDDPQRELIPPPNYKPKGLTDEVRTILGLTTDYMDAVEIRDALILRKVPHTSPKNLIISVHTILKRINDEVEQTERNGRAAYRLKPRALAEALLSEGTREITFKD